ncbi:unnamed protein product, partial [Rotaria socialis]
EATCKHSSNELISNGNVDILYSLVKENQRFDRLAFDSLYIRDVDFTANSLLDCKSKEYKEVLDRIWKKILPRIRHRR